MIVAAILVLLAAAPIVVPMLEPQPEDATVGQIAGGAVDEPSGWVRLRGRIVRLTDTPLEGPGRFALLVDAEDPLDAIVVRSEGAIREVELTTVTGHVEAGAPVVDPKALPLEATVFGAPPQIVDDRIVRLDTTATPVRVTPWPLAIPPLLLAAVLITGARSGYPVFTPTSEVDVLSSPLGPGERIPGAWGGRLGPHLRDLGDPGAALFVVRPGPKGNILTAQPLPDAGGPAPPPVPIGGGWSRGRTGDVHTISETVPALTVRGEQLDATLLFAKRAERDRVAALIGLERD